MQCTAFILGQYCSIQCMAVTAKLGPVGQRGFRDSVAVLIFEIDRIPVLKISLDLNGKWCSLIFPHGASWFCRSSLLTKQYI